jgi:hypothetical protein
MVERAWMRRKAENVITNEVPEINEYLVANQDQQEDQSSAKHEESYSPHSVIEEERAETSQPV